MVYISDTKKNTREDIVEELNYLLRNTSLANDDNVDLYVKTDLKNNKLSHGAYSLGCTQAEVTGLSTIGKLVIN